MTLKKGTSGKLLTTTEQQTLSMSSNDDNITQVSSTVTVYSVRAQVSSTVTVYSVRSQVSSTVTVYMYFVYRGVLYCYVSIEIDDVFVSDECKDSFAEFTKQKFEWTW